MRIVNPRWSMALSLGHIHTLCSSSNQYTITRSTKLFSFNEHIRYSDLDGFDKAMSTSKRVDLVNLAINELAHYLPKTRLQEPIDQNVPSVDL